MRRQCLTLCAAVLACTCAAFGQNTRSAVSVNGSDGNACTVPAPCRTFAKAITVTNSGGEIIALDSGGYGPFTIDRAVTVRPVPGAYAGLAPTTTDGITVSAGGTDDVVLRGITINGLGGSNGINYIHARSLSVENTAIDRLTATGIMDLSGANLSVSSTSIIDSYTGIQVGNGGMGYPTVSTTITNCNIDHNSNIAISVYQTGKATITNTVLANNGAGLIVIAQVATLFADVVIENSTISGNGTGIASAAPAGTATTRVSNCTISHNTTGLQNSGGQSSPILSRLNNTLQANGTNGTFDGPFTAD